MIEEPEDILKNSKKAERYADRTAEARNASDSTLREIRKAGMKVGVAINPGTPYGQSAGNVCWTWWIWY